jgi:AcrR family transcriptional regulator
MAEGESAPATAKGRATRDRIIGCAAELVLAGGPPALSLANVRKAAAVSGSQMTYYFADKDSLIRAVISHQTQAILDFHRQPALRDLDTLEDFDTWARLTLRFGRRHRARPVPSYGGLCAEIAHYDNRTREILADGQRQWAAILTAGLQRMKAQGRLTAAADPQKLAFVLMNAHQGATLQAAYRRSWPDPRALDFALSYLRMFAADPHA